MQRMPAPFVLLCLLGVLSFIGPFAIDMYLPAYPQIAQDLHVASGMIPLTLSGYFMGLAAGQLFYGPLIDRYGRKTPLCVGLLLFIGASIGCACSTNIYLLIFFRVIQAMGGCSTQVVSLAVVKDLFTLDAGAKILSRLFLFVAISPLLAPATGGWFSLMFGWRSIFFLLAAIVCMVTFTIYRFLPETHQPDPSISLAPRRIAFEYMAILKNRHFSSFSVSSALSLCTLFVYVAGSPILFMGAFHLTAKVYAALFALLALGFLSGSQINAYLLNKFTARRLFLGAFCVQVTVNLIFAVLEMLNLCDLKVTLAFLIAALACTGVTTPNGAALAMSKFTKNAGSASALFGFIRFGIGSIISGSIGFFGTPSPLLIIATLALTSVLGLFVLLSATTNALSDA